MRSVRIVYALALVLGALLLGYGPLHAAMSPDMGTTTMDSGSNCQSSFKQLDKGDDGKLSYYEYQSGNYAAGNFQEPSAESQRLSSFHSADKNRDSYLSSQEFCAWNPDQGSRGSGQNRG